MKSHSVDDFLALSARLTGFSTFTLHGTGLVEAYYDQVLDIVGERIFGRLLLTSHAVKKNSDLESKILSSALMGPVARNIILLWYTGTWNQLPRAWRQDYGASAGDLTHVVSAEGYKEGLMWRAVAAHPPAAKQPGFGSWTAPPEGGEELPTKRKARRST